MMRLTYGARHVSLRLMTIILMLAAYSCPTVDGWHYGELSEGHRCSIRNGGPGICTRITNCTPYVVGLRRKIIPYSSLVRCSFISFTEVICCPTGWKTSTSTTTSTTMTPQPPTTKTTTMQPIVIGNVNVTGNPQFWDLFQFLNHMQSLERTIQNSYHSELQNPTIGELPNRFNRSTDPPNIVRFTTPRSQPTTVDKKVVEPTYYWQTMSTVKPTRPTISKTTTTHTIKPGNFNETPSQTACRQYRSLKFAQLTPHILDGLPVEPGDYPHMGGLMYIEVGSNNIILRCGSSLISERHALTAAHCASDPSYQPILVRFGVVVWNSTDNDIEPYDAEIEKIILHPEYISPKKYHDIALIRLKENVPFSHYIRPICLNTDIADVDSLIKLVVIGWGVTNVETRTLSTVLLMTKVTSVGLQECNATHQVNGFSRNYRQGLNDGQYCAIDTELRKDACEADSGGPLQLVENKQSTIVGVVTFGNSCATTIPSIYARVAFYLTWIESIVWPS